MLRNGLSALTGVIAAVMLTMVIQFVAHAAFPPSKEIFEATRKIYDADPAVVEEASATTVIDDGGQVEIDRYGSLVISLEVEERS